MLHRLALGFTPLLDLSFDIERRRFARAAAAYTPTAPVFVIGLARAGTSMMTRLLHDTGVFASLSFRDMPFPLAPNSWARLSRGEARSVAATERGHGDGIAHDLDSPEAIEEVFWRAREGSQYRGKAGLKAIAPSTETMAAFGDFMRLVLLRYGRNRYLSKNNNNILRLPYLVAAFPDATLLHPIREPLQQAASLRAMHRRASALAADDPFRGHFMTWLGHHEFGADQRPFLFEGGPAPDEDRDGIDYWLKCWIGAYRHLAAQTAAVAKRQIFVDHRALCTTPIPTLARLAERLGMAPGSISGDALRPSAQHVVHDADPHLLATANRLYRDLSERFLTFGHQPPGA
ncbi:hypothetical protein NX02_00140 [Sphingomonas sanxanigenens DSM 19645 = NX02]|uniref:Sulfotransferase n=1 Tax=Sphingomonas sanxanigenens DSM 19645 = NX02 TaxID=1123269 RepID=W0A5N9_9SPHN|nr:hypothetical protein NX02_00140 [Sphingomonas sanxanigenens DSM 19645 = NX02]